MALKQKKLARSFSPFFDTKEPLQKTFQEPSNKIPPHFINPQHLITKQKEKSDPKFSFLLKAHYGKKVLHLQKNNDVLKAMNRQQFFHKAKIIEKPSGLVHFNLNTLANMIIFENEALVTRFCNLRAQQLEIKPTEENQNTVLFPRLSSKFFDVKTLSLISPCLKLMSNLKNMTFLIRHNEASLLQFQEILSYHKSIEVLNLQFSNKMNWDAFISSACSHQASKIRIAYFSFLYELYNFKYLQELNFEFNFKDFKELAVLKGTNIILNQLNLLKYNIKLSISFSSSKSFLSSHLREILQQADLVCLDIVNLNNFTNISDEKILSTCLQKKHLLKQNSKRTVDIIQNTKIPLKNPDIATLLNNCQALKKLFIILPDNSLKCSPKSENLGLKWSNLLEEVVIFALDISRFEQQKSQFSQEKQQFEEVKSEMGQYEEEYERNYPEFNEEEFYDYCPEQVSVNENEKYSTYENNSEAEYLHNYPEFNEEDFYNYSPNPTEITANLKRSKTIDSIQLEKEYDANFPEFHEKDFYDYCPEEPTTDYLSEIEAQYEKQYYQVHEEESLETEEPPQSNKFLFSEILQSLRSLSSLKSLCIFYSKNSSQEKSSQNNSLKSLTDELVGYEFLEKLELHTSEGYDIISLRIMLGSMMKLKTFEFHFYGSEKRFRWDIGFPFNDLYGVLEVKIKINKGVKFMPWDIRFPQGIGKLKTLESIEIIDETENVMSEEIFKTMESELYKLKRLRKVFLKMKVQRGVRSKLNVFRYQL